MKYRIAVLETDLVTTYVNTLSKYNTIDVSPSLVSTFFTSCDNNKLGNESKSAVKPDGKLISMTAILLSFAPTKLEEKERVKESLRLYANSCTP